MSVIQATKQIEKLADLLPDQYSITKLMQVQVAMALMPMRLVLDKVEGESVVDRAKRVGVSRNTWYGWYRGEIRPNKRQAARLEQLTGISAMKFQGRR